MSDQVRVRFAPSPTGYLHVGGARTALFNWLYARHTGGVFVLRIEDTDKARNTDAAMQAIFDGMKWLGLDWDEGPEKGGAHGPYFQSQREDVYLRYFETLKAAGHLYEDGGAWRFKFSRKKIIMDDLVCGRVEVDMSNAETHPDMTIRRPDGGWIFHFVNVVDDIEMRITHVIRGDDHLSNTPKHLQLFEALGVQPPRYGHIPLILNPDGSKMSKRDTGSAVGWYEENGFVADAVVNFLCLLGWNPKTEQEVMPVAEIVRIFDVANINRKAAVFDLAKCEWMNQQYIIKMPVEQLAPLVEPILAKAGISTTRETLIPVLGLVRERLKRLTDATAWVDYFFVEQVVFDPEAVEKAMRKPGAMDRLRALDIAYQLLPAWNAADLEATLKATATAAGVKVGEFVHPARVAATGRAVGASLYHTLEVLGRDRVLARFARAMTEFAG
ncbi:MAG: Glutamate--tRNA ligase 1 [Verrucomicrobiota bacterium]